MPMHQTVHLPAPPDGERLARVEERIDAVDKRTERIEAKLDDFAACKADQDDVDKMSATLKAHGTSIDSITGAIKFIAISLPLVLTVIGILVGVWLAFAAK